MLLVISGFPAAFIGSFFTNALLIETIFSLDGLGRLSFESVLNRDYAVVFATLISSGMGLLLNICRTSFTRGSIRASISRQGRSNGWTSESTDRPLLGTCLTRVETALPDGVVRAFAAQQETASRLQIEPARLLQLNSLHDLFLITLFAEFIANDKPFLVKYDGAYYTPIFKMYTERQFGGEFETEADYRDPEVKRLIEEKGGWMVRRSSPTAIAPSSSTCPCLRRAALVGKLARHRRPGPRRDGARHLRLPHLGAVRLDLTFFSALIGVTAGAVQGFFGGWTDLLFQRFIEILGSLPDLTSYNLSAILAPSFWCC